MNTNTSIEPTKSPSEVIGEIGWKPLLMLTVFLLLLPVTLFISAGSLNWLMAWLYIGMNIALTAISRIIIMRKSPDLIAERARFFTGEGVKGWDKVLVGVMFLCWLAILIVAGFDRRFGWPPDIPLVLQFAALGITTLGYTFATWAVAVNKFFSSLVRIQKDRGHTVVTTGPYQVVRHPGYAGIILSHMTIPLALGSLWALIPAGLTALLLILRTALEDRTLLEELDGYKEYTKQTRYRLLPGIW